MIVWNNSEEEMGLKDFFNREKKRLALRITRLSANSNPSAMNSSSSSTSTPSRVRLEEDELEQVFKRFDVNGDGKISSSELGTIMNNFGHQIDEDSLQTIIKEADSDGDGYINFQEFVEINTKDVDLDDIVEDLKDAFCMFDIDKNGYISAEELHNIMESLGEECSLDECKRMISGVDSNGDGTINFEEFKVMMMGSRLDVANEPQSSSSAIDG